MVGGLCSLTGGVVKGRFSLLTYTASCTTRPGQLLQRDVGKHIADFRFEVQQGFGRHKNLIEDQLEKQKEEIDDLTTDAGTLFANHTAQMNDMSAKTELTFQDNSSKL